MWGYVFVIRGVSFFLWKILFFCVDLLLRYVRMRVVQSHTFWRFVMNVVLSFCGFSFCWFKYTTQGVALFPLQYTPPVQRVNQMFFATKYFGGKHIKLEL